jgi:hypothetical protein
MRQQDVLALVAISGPAAIRYLDANNANTPGNDVYKQTGRSLIQALKNHDESLKYLACRAAWTMIALVLMAFQGLVQSTDEPYTFTTLAGGGGFSSPGASGSALRFSTPAGVAVDNEGSVYVADTFNHAMRKISMLGTHWVMTTLAGLPGTFGRADS